MVKNPLANAGDAGDMGSIPGSVKYPGEENGNPLQHSCLEKWMEEPGGLPSMTERLSTTLLLKNKKETQYAEIGFSSPTSSGALPYYIYSMILTIGTF